MTRSRIGILGAVALASTACAGSTRPGKAAPRAASGAGATEQATTGSGAAPGAAADMASAGGGAREIQGRIERIDRANNVTIAGSESVGHAFEQFKIDDGTEITVNGERSTLSGINPGDEVRASFSGSADELHLDRLEVRPSSE